MLAYWGAYHTQGPDMRQCQEHTMPGMDLREHAREVFPIIQRRLHIPGPKDLGGGQDEWPARQTGHWAHASPGLALEPHSGSCLPPACLSTVPGSVPSPGQAYAPSSHSTQDAYRHHVDAMVPAVLQHHHGQGRAGQGTFSRTPNTFQFVHFSNESETLSTSGQPCSHARPKAAYSQSHRDLREGGFLL